jgi:hypothetical protein
MITAIKKHLLLALSVLVAVFIIAGVGFFTLPHVAHSQASVTPITGYAWSDNIGWISLNCITDTNGCSTAAGNWGLSTLGGTITGYAWSDSIGWISANASDLSGCPSAPCTATISNTGAFSGWLKALTADNKGWDGWISLSGTAPSYGPIASSCAISGYAWGSDVVGWVDFSKGRIGTSTSDVYTCTNGNATIVDTHTDAMCNVTVTNTNCPAPSFCSPGSSVCLYPAPNPIGVLTVSPSIVQSGATTTVSWNIASVQSCTVSGSNNDGTVGSTDTNAPGIWSGLVGAKVSSGITQQSTYTLTCVQDDPRQPPFTESASVNIAPAFQEK